MSVRGITGISAYILTEKTIQQFIHHCSQSGTGETAHGIRGRSNEES